MHPRLNFEQFQKERKQRKRRRALLWVACTACLMLLIIVGAKTFALNNFPPDKVINLVDKEIVKKNRLKLNSTFQKMGTVQSQEKVNSEPSGTRRTFSSEKNHDSVTVKKQATIFQNFRVEEISQAGNGVEPNPFAATLSRSRAQKDSANQDAVLMQSEEVSDLRIEVEEMTKFEINIEGSSAQDEGKQNAVVAMNKVSTERTPVGVELQWIGLHSSILGGNRAGAYKSLNSFSIGAQIPVKMSIAKRLFIVPNYKIYRYQLQHEYSWEGTQYAPGSIIGYNESKSGYEPILSDTLNGVFTRTIRINGQISEAYLPIEARFSIYRYGRIHAELKVSGGMRFRASTKGFWNNETEMLPLTQIVGTRGRIGAFLGTGFEISKEMNQLEMFAQGQGILMHTASPYERQSRFHLSMGIRKRFK